MAFATLRRSGEGLVAPSCVFVFCAGGLPAEADGEGGTRTVAIAVRRKLDLDAGGRWEMGKVEPAQWRLPCGGSWNLAALPNSQRGPNCALGLP